MNKNDSSGKVDGMVHNVAINNVSSSVGTTEERVLRTAPSRRQLLGIFTAAGGIAGVVAWFGVPDSADGPIEGGDESSENDRELLSDQEATLRSQLHDERISSVPTFTYDPITEELDGNEGVESVIAEPADSESGDRMILRATSGVADEFKKMLVGRWGDPGDSREYDTIINDNPVSFDLYIGTELAIGITVRYVPSEDRAELLIIRGVDESVVESLLDDFNSFYIEYRS